MQFYRYYIVCLLAGIFAYIISCTNIDKASYEWKSIEVTATAYNSLAYQTSSNPFITAFGDSLIPGKKYIAVSRDLLTLGLKHNTFVTIDGFGGIYLVKDKMNKRWTKRIDIYMGNDVSAAKQWGKRKLNIWYRVEAKDEL